MAEYNINFSTNASKAAQEISRVNKELTAVIQVGQSVKLNLDTSSLSKSINTTFRALNKEIDNAQRKLSKLQIGSGAFRSTAASLGYREGRRERGELIAQPLRLRGQAQSFEQGSNIRLQKELSALQIEASQIAPNTIEWVKFQQEIAKISLQLQKADKLAEDIQLRENLGAFAPQSLAQMEAKLTILKNKAREIAPDSKEWKQVNKEVQELGKGIAKVNKKPLSTGQRVGAAGGAFLYGGGLGGGVGSAVGGIAGGLIGGVPGAFAGAAAGQIADNLGTALAGITSQAAAVQQLQRGLAMASVDAKDFAEAQAAVGEISQKLFMPLEQTTKYFAQLRVNTKEYNLSVEDTRQILEGTALAIMATGGSAEDLDGAMRAVVQIMSKGGVQAEELRGQLGERFPGAVVKFAQANKMSFEQLQKALEDGTVGIREFINFAKKNYTDYAKFSEQLATAPEYAGQRLAKAFEEMQLAIGQTFGASGATIQDFASQALKDITAFVTENKGLLQQLGTDFAVVFAGIMSVVSETGKFIIKVMAPVLGYIASVIRQLRVMTGAADAATSRAEMSAAFALMRKHGPGRAKGSPIDTIEYNKAAERYAKAEQQFKAAGGSAALPPDIATPQNLTYGGVGAGMPIDRQDKEGKDKKSKLSNFYEDQRKRLKGELDLKLKALEMDKIQNKISDNQYEIQKALLELDYEKIIINEGLKVAEAKLADEKLSAGDKDLKIQQLRKEAALDLANAEKQSSVDIAKARQTLIDKFSDAAQGDRLEQAEQQVTLEALKQGYKDVDPASKAYLDTQRFIADMHEQDIKLVPGQIAAYRARRESIHATTKEIERAGEMLDLQNRLAMAGVLTPRDEMRVRLEQEGYSFDQINQTIEATTLAEKAEKLKTDLQGIASSISNAFGEAFKGIITGSMTAQQALAGMFQSIADSFADMVAKMIAEYLRMQLLEGMQSILKILAPGIGAAAGAIGGGLSSGFSAGTSSAIDTGAAGWGAAFNTPLKFANGGVAPGGFTAFANGGIVTGPTLGLVGEGRYNEAVIPLPDGKSVPVQLSGGDDGSQISSNIVVNVNNGQAQSNATGSNSSELGRKIEGAVKQVIVGELRPGGLLASR